MNKDLIKTLIVLAIVIAGMAVSIAFFTRPENNSGAPASPSSQVPVSVEVLAGPFSKEGMVSSLGENGTIVITNPDGGFRVSVSEAKIINESNEEVSFNYLARGIRVSIKGSDDKVSEVRVISSPDIVIFSPAPAAPVGLSFKIEGSSRMGAGNVLVKIKNRRTGSIYLDTSTPTSLTAGRYGNFSLTVNLSSALDILDGDDLDAEVSQKSAAATGNASASWRYSGGLASKIKVFFVKNRQCGSFSPVDRLIDASRSAVRSGIEELIKGPSESEIAEGYSTALPPSVEILSLDLKKGVITVDFSSSILGTRPTCDLSALRREITETVTQFPGIYKVVMLVEGEEENPLNP